MTVSTNAIPIDGWVLHDLNLSTRWDLQNEICKDFMTQNEDHLVKGESLVMRSNCVITAQVAHLSTPMQGKLREYNIKGSDILSMDIVTVFSKSLLEKVYPKPLSIERFDNYYTGASYKVSLKPTKE